MKILALLAAFAACSFAQNSCSNAPVAQVDFTGTSATAVTSYGGAIRICAIRLTTAAAVDITLNTSPQMKALGVTGWLDNNVQGSLATAPGASLTITVSSSTHVAGTISYYTVRQ